MKKRQKIVALALAGALSVLPFSAYAQETEALETMQETMTEEEQKKEEARQYIETNGIKVSSENMRVSFTIPDSSWVQKEEGKEGYECNFVSEENTIELQILSGESAVMKSEDVPQDKEEVQRMVEDGIEVLEFDVETTEEKTVIKTILKFPETEVNIYRYAVSCQIYQGEECLEAVAHTDDEHLIYMLLESVSSAELL